MADERSGQKRRLGNGYELFILVLTLLSLAVMVLLVLPLPKATHQLLTVYDNFICFIFLFDFALRLHRATSARQYFIRERGWLDLLGSIPALGLGVFKYAGLFRLARLSRLSRIRRNLRGQRRQELINDFLTHRGQYAGLITVLAAFIVLVVASILVLTFESHSAQANITSGGDALWWAIVTITTVGYGDFFPVTTAGRITAVFVMFAGVGIIGALASILASLLVAPPEPTPVEDATEPASELHEELRAIRAELEGLRKTIAAGREQS